MPVLHSFEYELSQELSARVVDAFVRSQRKHAPLDAKFWKAMSILLVCTLVSVALLIMGYFAEIPFAILFIPVALSGFFGSVLSLVMISIVIARVTEGISKRLIRRQLFAAVSHPYDRKVRWTFTDEGFHVHTAEKETQVPWHAIRRFLSDSDFWFIGTHSSPYLILPVENLGNEVKELIRAKLTKLSAATVPSSDPLVKRGNAVVLAEQSPKFHQPDQMGEKKGLPFLEPQSPRAVLGDKIRPQQTQKMPFSRFIMILFAIGGTLFLLQKNQLAESNAFNRQWMVIGASALGVSFAIALMIKRAWKPAKLSLKKGKE